MKKEDTRLFHAVSLSGGKDSTAMLLLMIEKGMPIDVVLTADTGMEFPEVYEHLAKLDCYLYKKRKIHITYLRHPEGFEYLMFDEPKQKPTTIETRKKYGIPLFGNGWPGVRVRWCTGQLKTHLIENEVNRLKGDREAVHYVGIAADEAYRIKNKRYPLIEWGITEEDALQICYKHGFDWGGLYEIYDRCSCWCCPFQRIDELRKLRKHHPDLWMQLQRMDRRALAQFGDSPLGRFKQDWTVAELEARFAAEDRNAAASTPIEVPRRSLFGKLRHRLHLSNDGKTPQRRRPHVTRTDTNPHKRYEPRRLARTPKKVPRRV